MSPSTSHVVPCCRTPGMYHVASQLIFWQPQTGAVCNRMGKAGPTIAAQFKQPANRWLSKEAQALLGAHTRWVPMRSELSAAVLRKWSESQPSQTTSTKGGGLPGPGHSFPQPVPWSAAASIAPGLLCCHHPGSIPALLPSLYSSLSRPRPRARGSGCAGTTPPGMGWKSALRLIVSSSIAAFTSRRWASCRCALLAALAPRCRGGWAWWMLGWGCGWLEAQAGREDPGKATMPGRLFKSGARLLMAGA